MGIFSGISRIFGQVETKVDTRKGIVIVNGIPAQTLTAVMALWLRSDRIQQFMFISIKNNYFAFYEFYALEIREILEKIIVHPKTKYKIRRIAQKAIDQINEKTWLKNEHNPDIKPIVDFRLLNKLSWTPKPHQMEALKAFGDTVPRYGLKGFYIAARPGTGKTFYDIALATVIIPQSVAEVKIVISPKNAILNVWARTIRECFKTPPTDWVSNVSEDPPLGREYYIFHYEALDRAVALCEKLTRKNIKYFVIIDEAHNFNTLTSSRTKRLIEICRHAQGPYSIWASGSPIKQLGSEIMPILECIDPLFNKMVAPGFKKIFGGANRRANEIVNKRFGLISHKIPTEVVGEIPKALPYRVNVRIPNPTPFLIETVKADVQKYIKERVLYYKKNIQGYKDQFKECIDYHKQTLLTQEQRERYGKYEETLAYIIKNSANVRAHMHLLGELNAYERTYLIPSLTDELAKQFKEVRSIIKTLSLKVTGEAIGNVYIKRKAECSAAIAKHANLAEIIDSGLAKTLIFSNWIEPLEAAESFLNKQGYKTCHVYGKDSKNVSSIVDAFHEDPDVSVLLASYMALSTAVPVTAANQVVLIDYPYREYIYSQTVARAARIGQKHEVYVYELVLDTGADPNVSTRALDICQFSRDQVTQILGEEFGGFNEDDYTTKSTDQLKETIPFEMSPDPKDKPTVGLRVLCKSLGLSKIK